MDWPKVTVGGPGTRQDPEQCLYCKQVAGQPHGRECVVVEKRAKVRYSFELEIGVPHSWGQHEIEFHRNDGSWCADNALTELHRLANQQGCLCNNFHCEFLEVVDDTPRQND